MADLSEQVVLESGWKKQLLSEFQSPYMAELKQFLLHEKNQGKVIFPKGENYFKALESTPFDAVKVVVLGQDPYHGDGQAHGLSFSVPEGVRLPPSLKNIFKEINSDIGPVLNSSGCLDRWAVQGVLLLNSVLTVERSKAASHQGKGWEIFTDAVIRHLDEEREGLVFLLWGAYARSKGQFINRSKHLVLEAPHPSPLSAYRGFLGCRHFSKANTYLEDHHQSPINWTD
ncbi:MAG: uracil-DNA glycosylase [Pseudomonadales bacterium]|nr:uracil-DNA glycosylase [Pseudomonadales bacterium]